MNHYVLANQRLPPHLGLAPKIKLKIKIDLKIDEFDRLSKESWGTSLNGVSAPTPPFRAGTENKMQLGRHRPICPYFGFY